MLSRIFGVLLVVGLTTSPLGAQTDPFVGQWKLIKLTDQMTVTKVAANTYGFDFGGGSRELSSSARRLNARTVEIVRKSQGTVTQTRQIELSPDLKILTMTVHIVGKDEPYVYVFERQ